MPSSPTPSERERSDAEARAREKEDQAKLPYKWTQTIKDLDIVVPVAGNLRGKDIEVVMTKTKLKVAVKGQTPAIDVRYPPLGPTSSLLLGCSIKSAFIHEKGIVCIYWDGIS